MKYMCFITSNVAICVGKGGLYEYFERFSYLWLVALFVLAGRLQHIWLGWWIL